MTQESKDSQVQPYQEMDVADESQILSEMKGENFLPEFVYQFQQGGRTITSLSYTGIKEAIRRRGHYSIVDYKIEETTDKYRAIVKIHDDLNKIDALGASEADKTKPFAYVLALNKAERNAYAKLIPAKYFAELIAEKLGKTSKEADRSPQTPKDVTPTAQPTIRQQVERIPSATMKPEEQVPVSYQLNSWIKPEIYANLTLSEEGSDIILKPKERLEAPDFKAVCAAVEHFKGKWVSVDGVWVIPNA
jgi:hypothetical protein